MCQESSSTFTDVFKKVARHRAGEIWTGKSRKVKFIQARLQTVRTVVLDRPEQNTYTGIVFRGWKNKKGTLVNDGI